MQVVIYQSAGGGLSRAERLERLAEMLAPGIADLVICPELFTSGYNVGESLIGLAETSHGDSFQTLSELARSCNTAICYGYPETDGTRMFNSAAFVSNTGQLLANHRKRTLAPGSFEQDYFAVDDASTVVEYQGFKIALLICYEVEFPEIVRHAALSGAHLVVVPTALLRQWEVVANRVVPARAFENGVWLAYANHAGHENGFDYLGGSKIVAPDGRIVVDAGPGEILMKTAVDTDSVRRAQTRLPYLQDVRKLKLT